MSILMVNQKIMKSKENKKRKTTRTCLSKGHFQRETFLVRLLTEMKLSHIMNVVSIANYFRISIKIDITGYEQRSTKNCANYFDLIV